MSAKERCKYELFVENYIGLDSASKLIEDSKITLTYGQLVNMLCMFTEEQGRITEPDTESKLHKHFINGRLTPKVGLVYYIGNYTAPKVFNGLYYECLLTDQRIASHEEIKVETGVKITDWEHDIYKPERFGLRN